MRVPVPLVLGYATPRQPRQRIALSAAAARLFLGAALLLLAGEAFVLALPSLPRAVYKGSFVGVGEWARLLLENMTWIACGFSGCTLAVCWCFAPAALTLRLARSISLGVALFHSFLAPGSGAYGRMLWGAC